ncbi:permease [Leifsonia shinshuensis]|uniref:Permease n=1 Tax=Leifsonia shinshuensis TaxID=150026 RepID=A0A7G6YDI1_9MICO|nr:permease [Leifsonia shinshuensis]QNE36546.1 permease [Leifsonia shinshuensis]
MTTLRLAWLFARRSASADRSTVVLPVVAFATATLLLIVVAGGAQRFFSWTDDLALVYQALAIVAVALLTVPLAGLGGAAARLSARRRDARLSGLRLLGATPGMVAALTVIESTILAVAGALAGVILSLPVSLLVGLIPFRGTPLGNAALLAPGGIALAVLGVAALAAVSAALGLHGVIVSPLGVRTRQTAPRMHWLRALIAVAVVLATVAVMAGMRAVGPAFIVALLGAGFGATIAVLNLVGPWVLRLAATFQVRRARTPRRLLAARAILESPKAAWRQVSGVAMTSFVAVFAGVGLALADAAAGAGGDPVSDTLVADIRTGVVIVVIGSFLMVACSVGVNQAAAVLDRRDLYVSLHRIGMAEADIDAARALAVLSPLALTAIGSALTAAVVVLPLTGAALLLAPLSLLMVAACLIGGVLLVRVTIRATRRVLHHVIAEPAPSL